MGLESPTVEQVDEGVIGWNLWHQQRIISSRVQWCVHGRGCRCEFKGDVGCREASFLF